jgi:hypothetical protein
MKAIKLMLQKMFTGVLMSITLLTPFISPISKPSEKTLSSPDILIQEECEILLEPLIEGDISTEQLINPILTSQTEINEKVDLYSNMHNCLDEGTNSLSAEDRAIIQTLLEYFLVFAGGLQTPSDETTLNLVSLATSTDQAVVRIRDVAGIEAPAGYIFVRFYSSREAMPELVRQAFEAPDVAGVTILSRYIAVLAERKETWAQRALQLQTLPETISHELIHAYVNSTLGQLKFDLPAWYSEGLAIYFSGSEKIHTVVTPNFTISNTSTEDYQLYDITFKFLEASHGRDHMLELINLSIQEADPSILYQDLDISDDQVLISRARAWSQQRNNLARGGIIVVALITMLLLWRLAPEYKCPNCGHAGKKKDLIDEIYCPNCKRPHDRAVPW